MVVDPMVQPSTERSELLQRDESGLPTPNITAGEEDGDDTTNTDDGWDDFENDLEAELANDG
jgi:hypothetical protein